MPEVFIRSLNKTGKSIFQIMSHRFSIFHPIDSLQNCGRETFLFRNLEVRLRNMYRENFVNSLHKCLGFLFNNYPKFEPLRFMKTIEGKGEITRNEQFHQCLQCFFLLIVFANFTPFFHLHREFLSANYFCLRQSEICRVTMVKCPYN